MKMNKGEIYCGEVIYEEIVGNMSKDDPFMEEGIKFVKVDALDEYALFTIDTTLKKLVNTMIDDIERCMGCGYYQEDAIKDIEGIKG